MFKKGDYIVCIQNGGNNTVAGRFKAAQNGDGPFYIVDIHEGGIYSSVRGTINTIETACGKFLWNSKDYYKVINSEPQYEIY